MFKSNFFVLFTILAVLSIFPMVFAGCIVMDSPSDGYSSFTVVNNYDQIIKSVDITFLDPGFSFDGYIFPNEKIPPGKSKKIQIDKINKSYNAEVIVWFGNNYDLKDYIFTPDETTVITLNEKGILE
ncbi:MAG: hypothetical protein FWH41_07660 [Treponema sp.]|nr:hypothetical protein [Treponema sp.]MCL2139391.1 hypothetical protein [Treponema sp.]